MLIPHSAIAVVNKLNKIFLSVIDKKIKDDIMDMNIKKQGGKK